MKFLKKAAVLSMSLMMGAQACFVTVFNDTQMAVRLHPTNNPQDKRELQPNQKTKFGNKKTKADFVVAVPDYDNGEHVGWENKLHVNQERCGSTDEGEQEKKDKQLHLSSVFDQNLPGELADLFVIEDHDENAMEHQNYSAQPKSSCGCH